MLRTALIIGLLLSLDFYAFQAFQRVFHNEGTTLYTAYWGVSLFSIIWIILASLGVTEDWESQYKFYTHFRAFIILLYFTKILIVLPLIAEDITRAVQWFVQEYIGQGANGYPTRSLLFSAAGLVMGSALFLVLAYGMVKNPFRFQVIPVTIPIKNLPDALDGLKIIQISDLHSGTFHDATPYNKAVQLINDASPDLVFFTGDLVNGMAKEADHFIPVFQKIESRYGVYSILGNHDYGDYINWGSEEEYHSNRESLHEQHKKLGWNLLTNESITVSIHDRAINILGVENYSAMPQFQKHGDLGKTWEESEPADLHILLSHDPTHWDYEVNKDFQNIDLTLSGHTHGFQFGIEMQGGFRWSPSQWVYKRWAGLYQEGNQYLYVNRGIGCLGYPGRVGILPEITSITLKKVQ